jgi:hypothetical protein
VWSRHGRDCIERSGAGDCSSPLDLDVNGLVRGAVDTFAPVWMGLSWARTLGRRAALDVLVHLLLSSDAGGVVNSPPYFLPLLHSLYPCSNPLRSLVGAQSRSLAMTWCYEAWTSRSC